MLVFLVVLLQIRQKTILKSPYQSITTTSIPNETRTYKSKFLKITFNYPTKFQLEDKFDTIYLKEGNYLIIIDRVGTNYKTIDEYLNYLGNINKVNISDRQQLKVNKLDGVKATINHPNTNNPDTEVYYFYVDNWVYDISTTYSSLYPDLDQIAQSFRYTP